MFARIATLHLDHIGDTVVIVVEIIRIGDAVTIRIFNNSFKCKVGKPSLMRDTSSTICNRITTGGGKNQLFNILICQYNTAILIIGWANRACII